jgi:hypothetical protein
MDGAVPLMIGLIILFGALSFLSNIILFIVSFKRTFKTDLAFCISVTSSVVAFIGCALAYLIHGTVAGNEFLVFALVLFMVSVGITYRVFSKSEIKWVQ